jgi:hypothetical protein
VPLFRLPRVQENAELSEIIMEINNLRKLAILSVKQAQLPRKAAMAQKNQLFSRLAALAGLR